MRRSNGTPRVPSVVQLPLIDDPHFLKFPRRKKSGRPRLRGPRNGLTGLPDAPNKFPGPIGLDLLYTPPEPLLELIFVHGYGGGSRKTWSKTNDPKHFWPKEWLPRDSEFKHVRIHSFGYKSACEATKSNMLNFHEFGKSLLSEIASSSDAGREEVVSRHVDIACKAHSHKFACVCS